VQDAVRRLHLKGALTATDDAELFELCKKPTSPAPTLTDAMLNFKVATNTVVLKTVSEPRGIDQLNPKKTLQFDDHLTIVYGNNGCGKSGYVRILKQICGARSARQLSGNVFNPDDVTQSCKFAFCLNGGQNEEGVWSPKDGPHSHLRAMEVYDTDGGALYTTKENEVLFEPPLLSMIQQIINAAGRIEALLAAEVRNQPSQKPDMPPVHAGTQAAIWYPNIKAETTDATIDRECLWAEADQPKLDELTRRLAEANPAEEAKKARKLKKTVQDFDAEINGLRVSLDEEHTKAIDAARSLAASTRKTATEDAQKVFGQAPLSGIGEDSWKKLWEHARTYSTEVAYKDAAFPKTDAGALCVLCQQELNPDAKLRLKAFEEFVKGRLESEAVAAQTGLTALLDAVPELMTAELFATKLDSLQVTDDVTRSVANTHYEALRSRATAIGANTPLPEMPADVVAAKLNEKADALEEKAKRLDHDAKAEGKEALRTEARDLAARKWLSEQKAAVIVERNRLVAMKRLDAARRLLNTKALSEKKSSLTGVLITDAFIARFQGELKSLGAPSLKVAIKKTDTTKGRVLHQVQLTSARDGSKTGEVLSEGEQRVVSLAAFLADSEGGDAAAPFIFDDPISSLDQDYEEATVKRLVTLAKKRQVIVFTHRISLLTFLEDVAKSEGIKALVVGLQKESWGTGEPSAPPLFAMQPDKVLKLLLNDRVPRARKVLENEGVEAYGIQAKSICSEVRVAVERLVESTLLNGVVTRFRRSVNTLNKLDRLSKIKPEDCKLIDGMMTEYSKFEHSQSGEAPVALPQPEQFATDLQKLLDWHEEFGKRA
jgi:energy-coupling factor transporter ATP-binding protein EcfA2